MHRLHAKFNTARSRPSTYLPSHETGIKSRIHHTNFFSKFRFDAKLAIKFVTNMPILLGMKFVDKTLFSILVILSLTLTAQAMPRNLVRLDARGILAPPAALGTLASGSSKAIDPIVLRASLGPKQGVTITLTVEKKFLGLETSNVTRILQGEATFDSSHHKITAPVSVVTHRVGATDHKINILLGTSGARALSKRSKMIELTGQISAHGESALRLRRASNRILSDCATHATTLSQTIASPRRQIGTLALKQMDVLIEGDQEFFNTVGQSAASELAQIASMTDVIYQRDLGIAFNPTVITSAATFQATFAYNQDYELDFFPEMRSRRPALDQDVYLVITGKTPGDPSLNNVAGIADDIGAVCKTPSKSLTVVRRLGDIIAATVYTTAHEVGHLAGAEHDDQLSGSPTTGYIMNSGTGNPAQFLEQFSEYSKTQIGAYFTQYGSCLGDYTSAPGTPTPPAVDPTPVVDNPNSSVQLSGALAKSGGRSVPVFYAYQGDSPLAQYPLIIYRAVGRDYILAARLKTKSDGSVIYKRATRGKYVAVSKYDEDIYSNFVSVRR